MRSRFDQLLAQVRELEPSQRLEQIRALTLHPSFAALIAEVQSDWEEFAIAAGHQRMAEHSDCLEHCAGSLYALELLQGKFRGLCEAPSARPVKSTK